MAAPLFPAPGAPVVIQKKSGPGCWGTGCLIIALILVLILVLGGGATWLGYSFVQSYTSNAATPVGTFDGGVDVFNGAEQKITTFSAMIQQHRPASLTLTADEINTIIARDPSYAVLRGHLFLTMSGDQAQVQASFKLGDYEKTVFADRFVNGQGTFQLGFDPDAKNLVFHFQDVQIGSKAFPPKSVDSFNSSFNDKFNDKIKENAGVNAFLNQTQKLDIENGQIVIQTQ